MSGFGGHGERGAVLAIGVWLAVGLPGALKVAEAGEGATRWLGWGIVALGAAVTWLVVRRFDEGVGCLSALGFGAGLLVASLVARRLDLAPADRGLLELLGALIAPLAFAGALLGSVAASEGLRRWRSGAGSPRRGDAVGPAEPGRRVARHRIEGRVETDGLLSVHRASDDAGGSVYLQRIEDPGLLGGVEEARFLRDAERLTSLRHPRLVALRDFGVEGSVPWLAFDPWPERTLAEILRQGPLTPARTGAVTAAVAAALEAVHAEGLVHAALRPQLVHVAADETVLVSGLDLGWLLDEWGRRDRKPVPQGNMTYRSPEEIEPARPVTLRADVYRLGLVAFECLTGKPPFPYETVAAHVRRKHELEIVRPSGSALDRPALEVFRRCLAPRPEDRWPGATAFADALDARL